MSETMNSKHIKNLITDEWPHVLPPYKNNPRMWTVGIVMPVRSNVRFVKLAYYSIRYFTGHPYMFSFVNNQSNIETKKAMIGLSKNHSVWCLDDHREYNKGALLNFGLRHSFQWSNVRYGCIVDSDIIVSPNWMLNLIANFRRDEGLGICSPGTGNISDDNYNGVHSSCAIFRREVYEQLNGFDEKNDKPVKDFIERALNRGWSSYQVKDTQVHHFGSVTKNSEARKLRSIGVTNTGQRAKEFATIRFPIKENTNAGIKER